MICGDEFLLHVYCCVCVGIRGVVPLTRMHGVVTDVCVYCVHACVVVAVVC